MRKRIYYKSRKMISLLTAALLVFEGVPMKSYGAEMEAVPAAVLEEDKKATESNARIESVPEEVSEEPEVSEVSEEPEVSEETEAQQSLFQVAFYGEDLLNKAYEDYNQQDVDFINDLILNNGLDWNYNDPENWSASYNIAWTNEPGNKRINFLEIANQGITGTLDVSGCTALETLSCYNNQLTGLIVSGATSLKNIYCDSNQLTELDVSGLTSLNNLLCSNNKLTELNFSGCNGLIQLQCDTNQLSGIMDFSDYTQLKWLRLGSNQLTGLVLRNCEDLEYLEFYYNQLTELDVSGLNKLQWLSFSHNQLIKLDASYLPILQYLDATDNCLTSVNIEGSGLGYVSVTGNPEIQEFTEVNGDTTYFKATSGGRVKFIDYTSGRGKPGKFELEAVPFEGNSLIQWESSSDELEYVSGTSTELGINVKPTEGRDETITAVFTESHGGNAIEGEKDPSQITPVPLTITFDPNDGNSYSEEQLEKVTVNVGEKVTKPADISRKGYRFLGWSTDAESSEYWNFDQDVDQDMTLYSIWEEDTDAEEVTNKATESEATPIKVTKPEVADVEEQPTVETSSGEESDGRNAIADKGSNNEGSNNEGSNNEGSNNEGSNNDVGNEESGSSIKTVSTSRSSSSSQAPYIHHENSRLEAQTDGSFIEINEEGVPEGAWKLGENGEWIFDEAVPLGRIPKTGDSSNLPIKIMMLTAMTTMLSMIYVLMKKNRNDL